MYIVSNFLACSFRLLKWKLFNCRLTEVEICELVFQNHVDKIQGLIFATNKDKKSMNYM